MSDHRLDQIIDDWEDEKREIAQRTKEFARQSSNHHSGAQEDLPDFDLSESAFSTADFRYK